MVPNGRFYNKLYQRTSDSGDHARRRVAASRFESGASRVACAQQPGYLSDNRDKRVLKLNHEGMDSSERGGFYGEGPDLSQFPRA